MAHQTLLSVKLIDHSINPELTCAKAAKQCYSPENISDMSMTPDEVNKTLARCIRSGHLAVLSEGFAVVSLNITRECLTQLNTHAFIKTVTQSQQYVDHRDFRYHLPAELMFDVEAVEKFRECMETIDSYYSWFKERFSELGREQSNIIARQVLPNAAEANTLLSGNFWGWYTWLKMRTCKRNTPTTYTIANAILDIFKDRWPSIFNLCGPGCQLHGCIEGKPCGEPLKKLL